MNWQLIYAMAASLGVIKCDEHGRFDAGETMFLRRQLEYVYTNVYATEHPNNKARQLFPVDTSVPEGAQTFTYKMWTMVGMAQIIANYADDLPRVGAFATEFSQVIRSLGDSYGYSTADLRAAAMAGMNLDPELGRIARLMIENKIDDVAAFGDAQFGLVGFVNHPNIPETTLPNGDWLNAARTPLEILEDMRTLNSKVRIQSKDLRQADTMVFDPESFEKITGTPMSTDNPTSILKTFLDGAPNIRNVESWHKLALADAAGTGPRALAYSRDPSVVSLVIPMEFKQQPPQPKNLAFDIPCEARIGGIKIVYPLGATFADGL